MELGWQGCPFTFMGKEDSLSDSKYVIAPIPFDSTVTSKPGAREGPFYVIKSSRDLEDYDEETEFDLKDVKVHTANLMEVNRGDIINTLQRVEDTVREINDNDKIPILVGGEHSLSVGAMSTFEDDVVFLCFDAHGDLREEYEGCKYSNACVSRRVSERKKVIVFGVRCISKEELKNADEKKVDILFMKDIHDFETIELIKKVKNKKVYISIDLDVLENVLGVGTPEPNGLYYNRLLHILRSVIKNCELVGFDVMECNPMIESNMTPHIAASLIKKIVCYNETKDK